MSSSSSSSVLGLIFGTSTRVTKDGHELSILELYHPGGNYESPSSLVPFVFVSKKGVEVDENTVNTENREQHPIVEGEGGGKDLVADVGDGDVNQRKEESKMDELYEIKKMNRMNGLGKTSGMSSKDGIIENAHLICFTPIDPLLLWIPILLTTLKSQQFRSLSDLLSTFLQLHLPPSELLEKHQQIKQNYYQLWKLFTSKTLLQQICRINDFEPSSDSTDTIFVCLDPQLLQHYITSKISSSAQIVLDSKYHLLEAPIRQDTPQAKAATLLGIECVLWDLMSIYLPLQLHSSIGQKWIEEDKRKIAVIVFGNNENDDANHNCITSSSSSNSGPMKRKLTETHDHQSRDSKRAKTTHPKAKAKSTAQWTTSQKTTLKAFFKPK